jgi:tetratricopeptide (TPR) repeat protein
VDLVQIYSQLGVLYEDVAMFPKSEDAFRHLISLLHDGPKDQLAAAIGHLAEDHVAMGEVREAEKEQLEVLKMRESIGDPVEIAFTWSDLASLYIRERNFKKAREFAQQAMSVLADNPQVAPGDRIAIRQILATALCDSRECARAIPLLKDAIEVATKAFGPESLSAALASFLLGYSYWQSGDMVDAADWMQRGTIRMKSGFGWEHPVYVNAMRQYVRFLRQRGDMEAANTAEREVRQADVVVDAHSFLGRSGQYANATPR